MVPGVASVVPRPASLVWSCWSNDSEIGSGGVTVATIVEANCSEVVTGGVKVEVMVVMWVSVV